MTQIKRLFVLSGKERGFTLVEVIVAMAIISFVVLATWRVITSSLHSITRQDQKVKALHISQAHLGRLEAETFSRIMPENFVVPSARTYRLQSIIYSSQIVDDDGSGDASTGDFKLYQSNGTEIASDTGWSYDSANRRIIGIPSDEVQVGEEVYLVYEYYHLVDEGATIPWLDAEPTEKGVVKLVTDPADPNSIAIEEIESGDPIAPEDYDSVTRELIFNDSDEGGNSVWIYYLPDSDTDSWGPGDAPDGYLDPTENSIVGVVVGNFCNPDGSATNQITKTKEITLTEYWRQAGQIQQAEQKAYIMDR